MEEFSYDFEIKILKNLFWFYIFCLFFKGNCYLFFSDIKYLNKMFKNSYICLVVFCLIFIKLNFIYYG